MLKIGSGTIWAGAPPLAAITQSSLNQLTVFLGYDKIRTHCIYVAEVTAQPLAKMVTDPAYKTFQQSLRFVGKVLFRNT